MAEDVNAPVDHEQPEPAPSLMVEAAGAAPHPPTPSPTRREEEPEPEQVPEPAAPPAATTSEPEPEPAAAFATTEPVAGPAPVTEPPAPEAEEPEAEEPEAEEEAEAEAEPEAEAPPESKKHWYVVKVQSGREDTIKEAIERRMRKEGLEEYFGQIVIPVEKYTEVKTDKNGKRVTRTKERKLYPGYLMVEVEYNDRILYLFRETSGVGDFVGAHPGDLTRAPTPMSDREVQRMIGKPGGPGAGQEEPVSPKPKWLQEGDRVRVVDGTFNSMEGTVKHILESVSKVQVTLTIFGRPVDVDLEYYQVEQV
jgi:transcription termination/antitermination protein NusG